MDLFNGTVLASPVGGAADEMVLLVIVPFPNEEHYLALGASYVLGWLRARFRCTPRPAPELCPFVWPEELQSLRRRVRVRPGG